VSGEDPVLHRSGETAGESHHHPPSGPGKKSTSASKRHGSGGSRQEYPGAVLRRCGCLWPVCTGELSCLTVYHVTDTVTLSPARHLYYRDHPCRLKGLCHGQRCLHWFSDSEAYHEQMGPIPSSNGSLDIGLPNTHT